MHTGGGDDLWRVAGPAETVRVASSYDEHVRRAGTQAAHHTRRLRATHVGHVTPALRHSHTQQPRSTRTQADIMFFSLLFYVFTFLFNMYRLLFAVILSRLTSSN